MKKVAIIVDDVIRDLGPLSLLSIELKKLELSRFWYLLEFNIWKSKKLSLIIYC